MRHMGDGGPNYKTQVVVSTGINNMAHEEAEGIR
jgi:hypothetical protein